jgi:hypothetical protein
MEERYTDISSKIMLQHILLTSQILVWARILHTFSILCSINPLLPHHYVFTFGDEQYGDKPSVWIKILYPRPIWKMILRIAGVT